MLRNTLIVAAAVVAVGGGTATAAKLITGKDVKNGSLTGKDIKNRSLGVSDLSAKARASLRGQTGAAGAAGLPGAPGAKGDTGAKGDKGDTGAKGDQGEPGKPGDEGAQGPAGPSKTYAKREEANVQINSDDDNLQVIRTEPLPAGSYEIAAKLVVINDGPTKQPTYCELGSLVGNEEFFQELDATTLRLDSGASAEFSLLGTVTIDAPQRLAVNCDPGGVDYNVLIGQRAITAQLTEEIAAF